MTAVIDLGAASPKQARFYKSRALYTGYGGARGGGKTHAVRTKAICGALYYPGIRILIVRRTYPELQANHIEPMIRLIPDEVAGFSGSKRGFYFKNGSVIKFGNFRPGAARREYQGQEFDWIFLDEATQFTESEFRELGACLRGATAVPKRFYVTCNPGGAGHSWVKRLFVDRKYRDGENPDDYRFIFASAEDNLTLLRSSPAYLSMLENLPDNLRRAYRDGDWSALSGAYFAEFDAKIHVAAPAPAPRGSRLFRSFDYGLDMLACLWFAVSPDGGVTVYRELMRPGLVVSEAAAAMLALSDGEDVAATVAPPDMRSRQKDSGRSLAELFAESGIYLSYAPSDRAAGHIAVKEMLRLREDGTPRLRISSACEKLISDIAQIECAASDPNDCAVTPHDVTHSVDALRYFCVSRFHVIAGGEPRGGAAADYTDYLKFGC
ncbi:MAG: phage terminase large subunit [Oscillospiraceae bacterium]|jgi:phage terminase large subunit|nr:phage terminase large subunit [Oscillospiraceae bacterium]